MPSLVSDLDRPYWDMQVEPLLGTGELRQRQWAALRARLAEAYETAPYWRERLEKAGARPEEVQSWDDFATKVPVFTKDDYRELAEQYGGDLPAILDAFMGEAAKDLRYLAATSGTTGEPTPYPFSSKDLHLYGETVRRAAWRAGLRPGDRLINAFGLSMFIGGVPVCTFLAEMGVCVIPVGAEAGTHGVLAWARRTRPKALVCTPSLCEHLIETAATEGMEVGELGIEIIICGGEPGAGMPAVRSRIESAFGCTLYDLGAGLGASCGHPVYQGMHWLVDDLAIMELVDPADHEPIPLEDGAEGMAVFTPLEAPGLTGIRQTLGDLMRVRTSVCPCGRTGYRYEVVGRTDDMLKVKGVMVYPAAIATVVKSFVPRVSGEFRIVLTEPPPRVVPPLPLRIERGDVADEELEQLAAEIVEAMRRQLKIRPAIEWLPVNSLERSTNKTQLFDKRYETAATAST